METALSLGDDTADFDVRLRPFDRDVYASHRNAARVKVDRPERGNNLACDYQTQSSRHTIQ